MQIKIKSQLMIIKHNLIKNETSIKEIISHIRTNLRKKIVVNKISFEYRQYKDVLKKSEKRLSLSNHSKNDHEIILKDVNKLRIESIYNMSEKQT